eukprot:1467943-Heterocapsa_arctica.AAC.1
MQCLEALTEGYSLAAKAMNDKFKIVENSRYGWVPHTLIYKWLVDMWGGAFDGRGFLEHDATHQDRQEPTLLHDE